MQTMDGRADTPELERLYADFEAASMAPLWTQRDDLMPLTPAPVAVPHVWRWATLYDIAKRSGDLVPVGRGGERRAIGLRNPGLPGTAYATPTLWCAIQYLGGHETAPEHRHSQRFHAKLKFSPQPQGGHCLGLRIRQESPPSSSLDGMRRRQLRT